MTGWQPPASGDFRGPLAVTRAATVVLDAQGVVIGWSPAAQQLFGYPPEQILGRPLETLLLSPPEGATDPADVLRGVGTTRSAVLGGRHSDGRLVRLAATMCRLSGGGGGGGGPAWVLVVADLEEEHRWEAYQGMLRGLATQSPIGLAIYDSELRVAWANAASGREMGAPFAEFIGAHPDELYPRGEVLSEGYPSSLEAVMREVLATGRPVVDLHYRGRPPADPETDHVWSCSYYRLLDGRG